MEFNWWVLFVSALVPLIVGAVWYNPKVFGNFWMLASGVTEEEAQSGNMALIFGLTYLLSLFLAFTLMGTTIHQFGIAQTMMADPSFNIEGSELNEEFMALMDRFGGNFRVWKHGVIHGGFFGVMGALPIIGIIALFERKGWKYILIHAGYWLVSLMIMGALIAAFF